MGFIDETSKILGIDGHIFSKCFCYISPEYGIVVEGYKKVHELSNIKIILLCEQGKKIEIYGKNLVIQEIANKEISIRGQIKNINFD